MKLDLSRYAPPGFPITIEQRVFMAGLVLAAIFSLTFISRFTSALHTLYTTNISGMQRMLIPGAVMPDFIELLGHALIGFLILAFCMLVFIALHYGYYWGESKSIYLMRRLPNRWELHQRCLILPLCAAALSLITGFLLLLFFFAIYQIFTPESCMLPDQWLKIWRM